MLQPMKSVSIGRNYKFDSARKSSTNELHSVLLNTLTRINNGEIDIALTNPQEVK